MTDESKTKTVRNAMLGVVVVVLLGLVGCPKHNDIADEPDPSDVIDIVVAKEPLAIPEQLRKVLEGLAVVSIVLIDGERRLIPFSVGGVPRDICAPSKSSDHGARTCEQEVPSQDLMMILGDAAIDSASVGCGSCIVRGRARSCNKSNNKRNCTTQEFSCGGTNCVSN